MILDEDRVGRRRPLGPMLVTGALALAAATALGCGSDSSDKADQATASAPKAAAATTTTTAAKPAAKDGPDAWRQQGTKRLAVLRVGTPGTLIVEPHGLDGANPGDRWYDPGTKVTLTVRDTKTARFHEWAGACTGSETVCKLTLDGGQYVRVIAGFDLDKKAAKNLKKSNPALKLSVRPPGKGL